MGEDVSISNFPYCFSLLGPDAKALSQETSSGMLKLEVDFLKSARLSQTKWQRPPRAVWEELE